MNSPTITVLVTTYNYGQFIEQCIDSVLTQEVGQVQIVVVDDGSTDDTSERVKKYGSRIEYFYKPNGGQASALNYGFERARAEIIALLDADDFCLPGKLARIMEAFHEDPTLGMVYHRLREWHMDTGAYTELDFVPVSGDVQKKPDFFLSYVPHPTSAIAFRRSCLAPFLPIPENIRMLADCFPVSLMAFRSPVLAVPEFLTMYRIHRKNSYYVDATQIPAPIIGGRLEMWQIVIDTMGKWLFDNGYSKRDPPVRDFLNLWTRHQQMNRFRAKPPSRLGFLRYVLWENHANSPRQTWRFTAVQYMTAISALAFGYERKSAMDEWRGKILETVERAYRAFFGRHSNRSAP